MAPRSLALPQRSFVNLHASHCGASAFGRPGGAHALILGVAVAQSRSVVMVMLEVFCSDFMPEADDKGQRTFRFAIDCQERFRNR